MDQGAGKSTAGATKSAPPEGAQAKISKQNAQRREIQGNLTYLNAPGALKGVLDKIISAQVPDKFSQDYLSTVLQYTGGSHRQAIPVLKRAGFLGSDGKPTELYSQFRTDSGRASAAFQALKNGYAELFKRNEHAYRLDDPKLTDLIVAVTGLTKNDPVVTAIRGTFRVFSKFLPASFVASEATISSDPAPTAQNIAEDERHYRPNQELVSPRDTDQKIQLAYNINIVLPDTKDIEVFNAIFRSLRSNLMS